MNIHIAPRSIWLSRHGESMHNVEGKIGGDSDLSPRGRTYAKALPQLIKDNVPGESNLTVWTSTLKRTNQVCYHPCHHQCRISQIKLDCRASATPKIGLEVA